MGTVIQPIAPESGRPSVDSNALELVYQGTTNVIAVGYAFPSSGTRAIQYQISADSYGGGDITLELEWYSRAGSTSGTAAWSVKCAAVPANSTTVLTSKTFNATAATASTTINATNKSYLTTLTITGAALDSLANGQDLYFKVERTDAASITGDLVLYSLVASYSDGLLGSPGSGDVVGPSSATADAFARYNLTTGKLIKDSAVICDASGNLTGLGTLNTRTIANWIDGPAVSVNHNLMMFSGTGGKTALDAGVSGDAVVDSVASGVVANEVAVFTNSSGLRIQGSGGLLYTNIVQGPATATSGRVAVYNGATGKLLQNGTKLESDLVVGPASSTNGRVAVYSGTTGKLLQDGTKLESDLVIGPASSTNGNLPSYNGTGGKTLQDSGIAASLVTAHASRHNPGGADAMFSGTWSADDAPKWNGSGWVQKMNNRIELTTTAGITGTAGTLTDITGLTVSLPRAGTYTFLCNAVVISSGTAGHFFTAMNFTGTVTRVMGVGVYYLTGPASGFLYMTQTANNALNSTTGAGTATNGTQGFWFMGSITVSTTGTLSWRFARANASTTANLQAGSGFTVVED